MPDAQRQDEELQREEDRVAYLATCFALGELDPEGLRELYELLRRPGEQGTRAARTAWKVLGLTLDLRTAMGTSFQDTVRHRIERGEGPFLEELKDRLGMVRARLEEVRVPPAKAGPRPLWAVVAVAALALAALAGAILASQEDRVAKVTGVVGLASVEGEILVPGTELTRRPIIVGESSRLRLAWKAGHEAELVGPASAVPQAEGLSLPSGVAHVRSAGEFTLGLSDRQLICWAPARISASSRSSGSALAVAEGKATVRGRKTLELTAGWAVAGDCQPFRWQLRPDWHTDGPRRKLLVDPAAACWEFSAIFVPQTQADALTVRPASGSWEFRIEPGSLKVNGPRVYPLRGAPMLERRFRIEVWPGEMATLAVSGLDELVRLGEGGSLEFELEGKPRLEDETFHTGPPGP